MSVDKHIAQKNENVFDEDNRRQFLKKTLGLICASGSASMLSSCSLKSAEQFSRGDLASSTSLFSTAQMTALFAIVDTILPRTDTPSASEVDCHNFVQHQLTHCHSADEQQQCVSIVTQIDKISVQEFAKVFALLSKQEQQTLLNQLEQGQKFTGSDRGHFSFLKALVVFGYFTSEVGATQALNYQAVPGGFKGSIPSDENTKSWGSIDYY
jgi:hypothetical protein